MLATTDLHANVQPWDYLTGKPAQRGLASLATIIKAERAANPNSILVDAGDTVQGTPLAYLWQTFVTTGKLPAGLRWAPAAPAIGPMMRIMNYLRYDAMTAGNHEFNYGLKSLDATRAAAAFPWLSANTVASRDRRPFTPYVVKTVAGVRVGILGLTTPAVPVWEKPENIAGYRFVDPVEAAGSALAEMRAKHRPDIVVAVVHAGLERDPVSAVERHQDNPGENFVYKLASQITGIDAIVFGHTHAIQPETRVGDVLLLQPKNWGISVGAIDFDLHDGDGRWQVRRKRGRLLPVTEAIAPDPEVMKLSEPYHKLTEQYLTTAVTTSPLPLDTSRSRVEDAALIDAIHIVQMHYSKADVSFAASFNPRVRVPAGPVTVRQLAALYLYDNELYVLQGSGRVVREALENSARVYTQCSSADCASGASVDRAIPGYNIEFAHGVEYEIDLTRPAGGRIRNLTFKGKPLADDQPIRIALNSYRAGGSGNYEMFRGLPVVWRSFEDIREMLIRYYSERPLPAKPDNNWRIVPAAARAALIRLAAEEAGRSAGNQ